METALDWESRDLLSRQGSSASELFETDDGSSGR